VAIHEIREAPDGHGSGGPAVGEIGAGDTRREVAFALQDHHLAQREQVTLILPIQARRGNSRIAGLPSVRGNEDRERSGVRKIFGGMVCDDGALASVQFI
jgi:hypothetical protein